MKNWFDALPIHRKMVVMAVAVTTIALSAATIGLVLIDVWRYRISALDDTSSLAQVIAENTAAAVLFEDPDAAAESLATVRVRPAIRRACLYLPDGGLFAEYARAPDLHCGQASPPRFDWAMVSASAPVSRNQRVVGTVFVERDLSEIRSRIVLAVSVGLAMLVLATSLAYALAQRLHRTISAPIAQLAAAARAIGPETQQYAFPDIVTAPDEVRQLVRSFSDMVDRVRDANTRLRESNAEREDLLVREREASRLKDEFLAAVSHELRTPLNAILGWIQVLNSTAHDEQRTAKAIASIARNATAQTRLIEDLVDVSRIVTGKLHVRRDEVDVRLVAESAIEVVRQVAQSKAVTLGVDVSREACLVTGDRDRLQQIIANLLSNAIKFTPAGGQVSLRIRQREDSCEIDVSDTGIGIAPAFLPFVFDRFRQADGSSTREHGGLGLGLSIVKELTELHGGSVTAASAGEGRGATFSIRLPRRHVPAAVSTWSLDEHAAALRHPSPINGTRVLVVDDNADALDIVAAALTAAGATVRVAHSGAEAIEEWDREPADVLVCDLAMPQMDGFAVLAAIRARDAAAGRLTPAIALTAHASDAHHAQSRAAGFTSHLAKPYDTAALVTAIVAVIDSIH